MKYLEYPIKIQIYEDLANRIMDPDLTISSEAVRELDYQMNVKKFDVRTSILTNLREVAEIETNWKEDKTATAQPETFSKIVPKKIMDMLKGFKKAAEGERK